MDILLQKYYEYFLKEKIQDCSSVLENADFNRFHNVIINAYEVEKDQNFKNNLEVFNVFFSKLLPLGVSASPKYFNSMFTTRYELDCKKKNFENEDVSFEWFRPSKYLTSYKNSIISYPSSRKYWAKVYMAIKPDKYINTIIKLQNFVTSLGNKYMIEHTGQCKFRIDTTSNDAIVMSFACKEHYEEFLIFLDDNKDIVEAYDTPNLFLPQDEHGLSIITDNGSYYSYNYFVSKMFWEYMLLCRENSKDVNIEDLVTFISVYDVTRDKMIAKNCKKDIEGFKYVLISKLTGVTDKEIIDNIFNVFNKKHSKKK